MPSELSTPLASDTLADRAYRSIRAAVTTGELRPGQKVTERGLAARLSVSATPVREAIRRLEQDGLLERTGPRTVEVAHLGDNAVSDLAEVEVALRGMVARFAARHATKDQLDALDAILDEADDLLILLIERHRNGESLDRHIDLLLDAMQRFNDTVDACAGNPVLVRLLDQARVFSRPERHARIVNAINNDPQFGRGRYASHAALVTAIRAGDEVEAERIMTEDARGGLADLLAEATRA